MNLKVRYILIAACLTVTTSFLAFSSYAQSSRSEREIPVDDDPLVQPLPPGIRVRAFIHRPRVVEPSHLGTCTETIYPGDLVDWYDCAPWKLTSTGIKWKLSEATVPTGIPTSDARNAIKAAFAEWNDVMDPNHIINGGDGFFIDDGKTSVKTTKLDGTNAILWKRLREGVIGETYVWYDESNGVVIEVDTAFNNRHPWGILSDSSGECSPEDKYDLQNIATHEFGHWIGLDDVIGPVDLTMYLFGAGGELKKRTLGYGDSLGACTIYGTCPP